MKEMKMKRENINLFVKSSKSYDFFFDCWNVLFAKFSFFQRCIV